MTDNNNHLSEVEIRNKLADALNKPPKFPHPDYSGLLPDKPIPAAVLIPMLKKDGDWHVLLTRRNSDLHEHSGQVAFPGGRADPEDATPIDTALRETYEEVGVKPIDVKVLGRLKQMRTITNYNVTPIVGRIPWPYRLRLSADEVSRAFIVPIKWLTNPANHEIKLHSLPGPYDPIPVLYFRPYDGEVLWGVSARFMMLLLDILQPNGATIQDANLSIA